MHIGIDGGGTKTEAVLCDAQGTVLAWAYGESTNPADLGADTAAGRMIDLLDRLLQAANGRETEIDGLYAGVSGAGSAPLGGRIQERLLDCFPRLHNCRCTSDALNSFYGELGRRDGIALIAGTGASAFCVHAGEIRQVDGWGYLIDDAGGGFWIGSAVLRAAFRARDGRGPHTVLEEWAEKKLETPLSKAIPQIYAGGKRYVASFAPLVFEAAGQGDAVAVGIVQTAADELVLHLNACAAAFSGTGAIPCVRSGSLWKSPLLCREVEKRAGERYQFYEALMPPVYGALTAAAILAGDNPDEAFRAQFQNSLEEAKRLSQS